ncbi:MAG: putative ABC transporter ATP-binding protein [Methanosaeta sp. PtaB.Bin039]|nr:MAG: putative ABC transporter ATP-binding protein [Methanosaeta sp. PtaB.Bin039]
MGNPIISMKNLSKAYHGEKAVDNVNLEIDKGEFFGLLGPNGAGKSTVIKMLTTIIHPTEGTATIHGHDIIEERDAVRSCIGVVFQDSVLDRKLTGRENLDFHARLYGLRGDMRRERIEEVLELVELKDKADVLVERYSGGMQRRLAIARGLMHHPGVLFLDEPTLGLDAQSRRHIWKYVKELNLREDITIVLTTHYMEEADQLCERVAIIDRGRIVALDTPENLKGLIGADTIVMHIQSGGEILLQSLSFFPWIASSEVSNGKILLRVDDAQSRIPQVVIEACMNRAIVSHVGIIEPTLEDVFLKLTGRTLHECEDSGN